VNCGTLDLFGKIGNQATSEISCDTTPMMTLTFCEGFAELDPSTASENLYPYMDQAGYSSCAPVIPNDIPNLNLPAYLIDQLLLVGGSARIRVENNLLGYVEFFTTADCSSSTTGWLQLAAAFSGLSTGGCEIVADIGVKMHLSEIMQAELTQLMTTLSPR
jgi:hypothetical protein